MLHEIERYLGAYPLASASSLAFYLVLTLLAIPASRRVLTPLLSHPILPTHKYLNAFDAIRGLAACLVAVAHCWWMTYPLFAPTQLWFNFIAYGTKAVPVFAVLSGFLIYRSVLSIRSLQDLRTYVVRRFFRIYPVYFLGVVLCVAFGQYIGGEGFSRIGYLVSDLFLFNVISWPAGFANPPAWSLYVECAFYALLPLIVLTVGRGRIVGFCLLVLVAMLLADHPSRVFGLWKFFVFGILAAELSPSAGRVAFVLSGLGVGLLLWDFGGTDHDWFAGFGFTNRHADGDTVGLGLSCAFIMAALPHLGLVARALNVLPLRMLGTMSYSVYLIQFFYIAANFPEIGIFSRAGTPEMYAHFKSLPMMPAWYLPLLFFPGVLFWGLVSFLLVERPGIMLGQRLVTKARSEKPIAVAAE
jgi:peptidoglycan/LPS O-acetylase OafA/YrhL